MNRVDVSNDTRILVSELKIGMFVTGLDRDWLETPFLIQGFYIRAIDDINEVAKYCRHVWVLGQKKPDFSAKVDFKSGVLIGRKPTAYVNLHSAKEEYPLAHRLYAEAKLFTKNILAHSRVGHAVDTAGAKKIVRQCVQSIIRQPDALSWMSRMRREDEYTAEHCLNVCILAIIFGRRLGMKEQQLNNVGLCGLLHDIGKMRIPNDILNKPGSHSEAERQIMRTHARLGKELLEQDKGMFQGAIDTAFSHHERPDGTGYPRGLTHEALSLMTKIIAIVDAYDAITSDRIYARGRPPYEALRIIYETRGQQFDDGLALAFIETIGLYPPGSIVELVNGYVGFVYESAKLYRHLPKVLLLRDAEKKACSHIIVDLVLTESGELDKGYHIVHVLPDGSYGVHLSDCLKLLPSHNQIND